MRFKVAPITGGGSLLWTYFSLISREFLLSYHVGCYSISSTSGGGCSLLGANNNQPIWHEVTFIFFGAVPKKSAENSFSFRDVTRLGAMYNLLLFILSIILTAIFSYVPLANITNIIYERNTNVISYLRESSADSVCDTSLTVSPVNWSERMKVSFRVLEVLVGVSLLGVWAVVIQVGDFSVNNAAIIAFCLSPFQSSPKKWNFNISYVNNRLIVQMAYIKMTYIIRTI